MGTIIQRFFCAQSGAGIRLNFWKWFGKSRYPGALSPVLENFRRAYSLDPTDCPWVSDSEDALFRTNRKSDIRSVNCISLVGHIFMARECRHGLSIQTDNTNCKIRILKRCSRFIAGFFWQSSSAREVQLLGGGGLKLARLRCQGKD